MPSFALFCTTFCSAFSRPCVSAWNRPHILSLASLLSKLTLAMVRMMACLVPCCRYRRVSWSNVSSFSCNCANFSDFKTNCLPRATASASFRSNWVSTGSNFCTVSLSFTFSSSRISNLSFTARYSFIDLHFSSLGFFFLSKKAVNSRIFFFRATLYALLFSCLSFSSIKAAFCSTSIAAPSWSCSRVLRSTEPILRVRFLSCRSLSLMICCTASFHLWHLGYWVSCKI
mmetsp:Transcript_46386/g.82919  ORF Transcript_46386/g.82919 Transcript_46386/m.82919 type:complete len:229 (-) Transcript_46386:14021-14707(-)